jgi:predicted PurR-regulated permease PerM
MASSDRSPRSASVPPHAVVPPAIPKPPVVLQPQHLYKAVGLLLIVLVFYRFFDEITRILLIVYASAVLAVALNVVVRLFPAGRRLVAAALGVLIFAAIGAVLWFGVPVLLTQFRGLTAALPELEETLQDWAAWVELQTGLDVALLGQRGQEMFGSTFQGAGIGQAFGLIETLFLPLVVIMGGLYAVGKPNDRLLSPLMRAVPRDRRLAFRRLFELLAIRLRGWVKGTVISMLVVGTLAATGLHLLGVEFALVLGVISALVEIVPIVGPWVGGILAVAVALMQDPTLAFWVAILMLAIQQLESNLITPLVMASVAEVHPFVTLFAIFFFWGIFGFLGVVLALPLVFLFWTAIEVLWVERAIDTDEDRIEPVVKE